MAWEVDFACQLSTSPLQGLGDLILMEAGIRITKCFTQSVPLVSVLELSEMLFIRSCLRKFVVSPPFQADVYITNSRTWKSTDVSQSSQLPIVPA